MELLDAIFRLALPPDSLLDPTPTRSLYSRWALANRAKHNLTEVCWRWRPVAQTILYAEISLRDADQARALARSLRKCPSLGRLVKKLIVDCPDPPSSETWEVKNSVVLNLVNVLHACNALRTLIFTDVLFVEEGPDRSINALSFPGPLTDVIAERAGTLRCLEQWPQGGASAHFQFPVTIVLSCDRLVCLTINIEHQASEEHIALPFLEELNLSRQYDVEPGEHADRFALWSMPRLKRVVLPAAATYLYHKFLETHGATITYLEFRDHLDLLNQPRRYFCQYVHLCRNLLHFVFDAKGSDYTIANEIQPHPTLQYIDIWVNSPSYAVRTAFKRVRESRDLAVGTQWKNVRLLDRALHWVTELPTLFPPDTPEDQLPSYHRTPGLSIVHTDWGVYRSDLDQLHPDSALPPNMDDGRDTELDDEGQGLSLESDERSEEHSSEELSVLDDEENDSDQDYLPEPDMPDEGESDFEDSELGSEF